MSPGLGGLSGRPRDHERSQCQCSHGWTPDFADKILKYIGTHTLDQAEENVRAQGVILNKIIRKGAVLEVLKQIILEEKADLLVLGHADRSFFKKSSLKGRWKTALGD